MAATVLTGIDLAIKAINYIAMAVNSGMNFSVAFERVSNLLRSKREANQPITQGDLVDLFDEGDELELEAKNQFEATLADPNTPRLGQK